MRAGNLRHRVTIQRRTVTVSEAGSPSESWATVGEVWARIAPAKGKALAAADQSSGVMPVVITIRKPPYLTIDQDARVVHGGAVYQIQDPIDPDLHGERMELICNLWRSDGELGAKV